MQNSPLLALYFHPMKFILYAILFISTISCHKLGEIITVPNNQHSSFVDYRIAKGQHYSDHSLFVKTEYSELRFLVQFDSSAFYTTVIPGNQYDINKLYGFSDNDSYHHEFSARIGWRWSDNALRLFGYIYNNSIVSYQELGIISIGPEHDCSIKIEGNQYIFSVDGHTTAMPRTSPGTTAKGYKLFPYFGGDETAPHEIHIWIKEN
jgi:hypothetical protein